MPAWARLLDPHVELISYGLVSGIAPLWIAFASRCSSDQTAAENQAELTIYLP